MKIWLALAAFGAATALAAQVGGPAARLAGAQAELAAARQRSAQLEAQAQTATDEADRARAAQAAVAARIQAAEAGMSAAQARLTMLAGRQRAQERRLAARQQPIVELIAAVQIMARRPAAAALVRPGSLTDLVHVQAMLSSMTPQIAARTAGLREELARARRLRGRTEQAMAALRRNQEEARIEHRRLARLETEQRQRFSGLAASARLEAARALALSESTRTLEELVRRMGQEGSLRDRLASLPGPLPRPITPGDSLPIASAGLPQARLAYRLPVLGPISRGFGEMLPSGARSRGVTIAARPGSLVVAPAAGRVTFAGLYRGYGAIAIVDHGGGDVSLITGLAANIARIGDTVRQGGPLGRSGRQGVSVELRRAGEPIDLATLVG